MGLIYPEYIITCTVCQRVATMIETQAVNHAKRPELQKRQTLHGTVSALGLLNSSGINRERLR